MIAWRITKVDSTDLGFALSAAIFGAVTGKEFRLWVDQVILDLPISDIPHWFYDLADPPPPDRRGTWLRDTIPFTPGDPLLEKRRRMAALTGISHLRGLAVTGNFDPWISQPGAMTAITREPDVLARFRDVFPFITLPKV